MAWGASIGLGRRWRPMATTQGASAMLRPRRNWTRGVAAQHASLSRWRSPVRIRSGPPSSHFPTPRPPARTGRSSSRGRLTPVRGTSVTLGPVKRHPVPVALGLVSSRWWRSRPSASSACSADRRRPAAGPTSTAAGSTPEPRETASAIVGQPRPRRRPSATHARRRPPRSPTSRSSRSRTSGHRRDLDRLEGAQGGARRHEHPLHGAGAGRRRGRRNPGRPRRRAPGRPRAARPGRRAATLAKDLAKNRKRLAFLRADAIGPDVRALAWGDTALFGVDRVKDLGGVAADGPPPRPGRGGAFDPGDHVDPLRRRRHHARPRRLPDAQEEGRRLPVRRRHRRDHRPLQGMLAARLGHCRTRSGPATRARSASSSRAPTSLSPTSRTRHRTTRASTPRGPTSRPTRRSSTA